MARTVACDIDRWPTVSPPPDCPILPYPIADCKRPVEAEQDTDRKIVRKEEVDEAGWAIAGSEKFPALFLSALGLIIVLYS